MLQLSRARALIRADPARACLAALVLGELVLIATLPVIVGQDLPQHLSYARILADYADPRLAFQSAFTLPARPQPYFTAYLLLAPLTRLTSVLTACRVLYGAYVVAMAASFAALVTAIHAPDASPARKTPWTVLFGALLPWNPVQLVGFLPFMLALPAILAGAAAIVRSSRRPTGWTALALVLATAATTSLHLVAGATLVVFSVLYALFHRSRRAFAAALGTLVTVGATLALWHALGERGLAEFPTDAWVASVRSDGLLQGTVTALGVQWNASDIKWSFVVATVLGPLPRWAKLTVGVGIVALAAVVVSKRSERRVSPADVSRWPFRLAALAFLLLVVATPASIRLPDDICLLDFRLYVVAFLFGVACLEPRWFEPLRARVAVTAFGVLVLGVWARQLGGAAGEAMAVVRLVDGLQPTDTVLALPFHDRSEYLDEDNSVTHYFPVYFTALRGGVTSSFWGKFSHHLPVGYRTGREPQRPPDWDTARFTRAELTHASHVLVEWPDVEDGDARVFAAERLRDELDDGFTPMGCDGRWCLFRSPPGSRSSGPHALTEPEEALR